MGRTLTLEENMLKGHILKSSIMLSGRLYTAQIKQRLKPTISHCVSMFLGAVLVCAQQQQPVLPGYGSEHSTCQDACPGSGMDTATPFQGGQGFSNVEVHISWFVASLPEACPGLFFSSSKGMA